MAWPLSSFLQAQTQILKAKNNNERRQSCYSKKISKFPQHCDKTVAVNRSSKEWILLLSYHESKSMASVYYTSVCQVFFIFLLAIYKNRQIVTSPASCLSQALQPDLEMNLNIPCWWMSHFLKCIWKRQDRGAINSCFHSWNSQNAVGGGYNSSLLFIRWFSYFMVIKLTVLHCLCAFNKKSVISCHIGFVNLI